MLDCIWYRVPVKEGRSTHRRPPSRPYPFYHILQVRHVLRNRDICGWLLVIVSELAHLSILLHLFT